MTFTVLSDADIQTFLHDLDLSKVNSLASSLSQALIQFSCHNEEKYQGHRIVVERPTGQTTSFLPSTDPSYVGVKIIGVRPSQDPTTISPTQKLKPALQCVLTICDEYGQAIAILNASELTAFRTALASMLLYRHRKSTQNIVVFGAGKQALWHIRLALILRGVDIRRITIVNRSSQRTRDLLDTLSKYEVPGHITIEDFNAQRQTSHGKGTELETLIKDADAIFCTTPSTTSLFPASYLLPSPSSPSVKGKSPFISAIGSYRPDMSELDPGLLTYITDPNGPFSQHVWRNKIVVDSKPGCMAEAGELIKAEIKTEQIIEVGEIEDLRGNGDGELKRWVEEGLVVYKSVGVGVMDIAVARRVLDLAKERGVGTSVEDF